MENFVVETHRLGMRPMNAGDYPALAAYLQDDTVMGAFGGAFSDAQARAWYQRQLDRYAQWVDFGSWALILKETGAMIGQCGLTLCDVRGAQHMEVGYILARPYWGRGYATEGATACRDYAFGPLGRDHVVSRIRCDNLSSINVAIRNGMTAWDCLPDDLGSAYYTLVFRVNRRQPANGPMVYNQSL